MTHLIAGEIPPVTEEKLDPSSNPAEAARQRAYEVPVVLAGDGIVDMLFTLRIELMVSDPLRRDHGEFVHLTGHRTGGDEHDRRNARD